MTTINHGEIERLITKVDQIINKQLNAILHHAKFQRLEASWRGLKMVVDQAGSDKLVKIKVLNFSEQDISKDSLNAIEFDQSQLFKKVYSQEFDQPGGEPFGLLIGDYYFSHRRRAMIREGISVLQHISKIAAAAYCPFIAGVEASFFGLNSMTEMQPHFEAGALFSASRI